MVHRQALLRGGLGAGFFPISFFQGLSFLHVEITLLFAKSLYAFKEKDFFYCHHSSIKNSYSNLSKNEPENIA